MENLDRVPRKFQMLQVTSEPGSSHMRLGLWKLQPHIRIPSLPPAPMTNWSPMQQSTHDESVSFNRCILRPKLISIYKLDSHEDMVTAPASPEQWIGKLAFVTMYQFEKQHLYLFCYMSTFTSFQWPNCETWWFVNACARVGKAMPMFLTANLINWRPMSVISFWPLRLNLTIKSKIQTTLTNTI